jgi:predicted outer membrane lipoprotein
VFEGVFDSGIWFFILGVMLGAFAIIATMLTEATSE